MIEARFYAPPGFVLGGKVEKILEEARAIIGNNLDIYTLGQFAPVSNAVTKVIGRVKQSPETETNTTESNVSIWYDPDADRVYKRGIKIGVYGINHDDQFKIYDAIISVLGLDDRKAEKTIR